MEIGFVPQFALKRLAADSNRRAHWNILLSSLLLILFFSLSPALRGAVFAVPHFCLFETLTGLPCPGCGLLRSLGAFFSGDVAAAWAFHPAGPLLALFLLVQVPYRAWLLASPPVPAVRVAQISRFINRLGVAALFGGWLFKFHH